VREIVAIAHAVGSDVIAEGVENEAQRRHLQALGVRLGQGYLFARPLQAGELLPYLASLHTPAQPAPGAGTSPGPGMGPAT
jgi:EAL domain-containing protein (putative c-di-GMP-specific phosphodiesterase class I)